MRKLQHSLEYATLAGYARLARALPRSWALRMGQGIGRLGWALRLRRGVVLENLARVFPDLEPAQRHRLALDSCRNFGRAATEFARFPGADREHVLNLVDVHGLDQLRTALARDSGALVVTGHLGSWALYVTALAAHGIPVALLVGKQSNPLVDRFIHQLPGNAVTFIPKGPLSPRGVLRCLHSGKAVLIVADQYSRVGVDVPFLGHVCRTLSLPGALIERRDHPLFVLEGFHRGSGHHRVDLARLTPPAGSTGRSLRSITELCNLAIGAAVLRHPEQYFWHHRRWRVELGEGHDPHRWRGPSVAEQRPGHG